MVQGRESAKRCHGMKGLAQGLQILDEPILIIGQLTGNHPFMAVVIQDAALLAETRAVEAICLAWPDQTRPSELNEQIWKGSTTTKKHLRMRVQDPESSSRLRYPSAPG